MLTLLEGGFGSVCHDELNKMIRASVAAGRRSYLFVPEQQTLTCESEMCEILPPYAPQIFEVTNFTRFANTAFRILGGIGGKYCTGAETSLIMWRVLSELSGSLSLTGGKKNPAPGTVERALSAVREMQSHGILPEDISALVKGDGIRDRRLYSKLTDLSLIYGLYRELITEKYNDLGEDAAVLAEKLSDNPEFLTDCDIFVDGFISFTEPQYRLLSVMMRHTSVTVTLTLSKAKRDAFEYSEVRQAEERLKGIARKAGSDVRLIRADAPDYKWCPELTEMCDLLYSAGGEIDNDSLQILKHRGGRVRIFEAHDPFEECDFVAADIRRRVMEGASYSDFVIIARSAEKYVGILDTSLMAASVPHFISKRRDIGSFEAIKLIHTAYQIVSRGFKREDVLTYAKCGLAGISRDATDELELYVLRWGIDGSRFTDGIAWNMNPRGYTEYNDEDHKRLASLEKTRAKLIEPLVDFATAAKEAETVKEQAVALMSFLERIKLEKCLYSRAKELYELGEIESAEENARLWQTICSSLDTLVDVLGECESDPDSFSSLLDVVFREASIARLPLSKDQVTVGSADTLRIREKRFVYLIGVNAGEFPASVSDTSYFSDRDKAALMAAGLAIEPDLSIKNARELYCFIRAFRSAKEAVTILYTSLSASMAPLLPAEVVGRITDLSHGEFYPRKLDTLPLGERIFSPHDALMLSGSASEEEYPEVRAALVDAGLESIVAVAEMSPINSSMSLGEGALALIYKGDVYMSQSRLNKFRDCPFSYYARYILKLDDDRVSELSADVIGSFIHSVLENFFRSVYGAGRTVGELTEEEKNEMARAASGSYIELVLGGGFGEARKENAIGRLCRAARPVIDGLCEEFRSCKYTPKFFELSTAGRTPDTPDPIVFPLDDGTNTVISGTVDRVDTMKIGDDVYVRVVDYKSGSKTFDPKDLEKGENLQMFLYLKSIVDTDKPEFREKMGVGEGGRLVPAGVMYVKTSLKDTVVDSPLESEAAVARSIAERDGMLLDELESIGAMSPSHLPKGVTDEDSDRRYDMNGWTEICKTIEKSVTDIVREMKSGDVSARPRSGSRTPCSYCPYKAICRSFRKK